MEILKDAEDLIMLGTGGKVCCGESTCRKGTGRKNPGS
jgi:hypothetical protein